jgi:hypothetical protein
LTKYGSEQAALVAFDLLDLGGDDLRQRPLEKRRESLMRLVAKRRGDGIVFNGGQGCDAWARGHCVEASGQLLSERTQPGARTAVFRLEPCPAMVARPTV